MRVSKEKRSLRGTKSYGFAGAFPLYKKRCEFYYYRKDPGAQMKNDTAILSSFDKYTTFKYGNKTLTFRTCNGLDRCTKVNLWDHGYLEVMAKYRQNDHDIEEYIDLIPVLEDLYMDKDKFLDPIRKVKNLQNVLDALGFNCRIKGDHFIYAKLDIQEIINIQPEGNKAKAYQVKQVRNLILKYRLEV